MAAGSRDCDHRGVTNDLERPCVSAARQELRDAAVERDTKQNEKGENDPDHTQSESCPHGEASEALASCLRVGKGATYCEHCEDRRTRCQSCDRLDHLTAVAAGSGIAQGPPQTVGIQLWGGRRQALTAIATDATTPAPTPPIPIQSRPIESRNMRHTMKTIANAEQTTMDPTRESGPKRSAALRSAFVEGRSS